MNANGKAKYFDARKGQGDCQPRMGTDEHGFYMRKRRERRILLAQKYFKVRKGPERSGKVWKAADPPSSDFGATSPPSREATARQEGQEE